jgi:enoyl-CoA hydratase/carnithine racemase
VSPINVPGDRIEITVSQGVCEVRLNRPEKLNAFDAAMFEALLAAGREIARRHDVRAVVLSAAGRAFSAGLDVSLFRAVARSGHDDTLRSLTDARGRIVHDGQLAAWQWQRLPVPVVAAVQGVAFGAGLQLALGADIRIVAPDVRMSVLEVRWGLTPDMGATLLLPRLVGPEAAKELVWTGREVGADDAVRLGLALRAADDPRAAARALAGDIARRSPDAIRGAKHLLNLGVEDAFAAGFAEERRVIQSLARRRNQVEATAAYLERREPAFVDAGREAPA